MVYNPNKKLKLYYNIGEVAKMFNVRVSTLRYWEQEFPYLRPKTVGDSKSRQYSEADIEHVRLVYNLVKVRGFKISAAKNIINRNKAGAEKTAEVLDTLMSIRDELTAVKRAMDTL